MKKMKKCLLLLILIGGIQIKSQIAPNNCVNYLNDFIPLSTDPVLEVGVVFWVFSPSSATLTDYWNVNSAATPTLMDAALAAVNLMYSSVPVGNILLGATPISDSKIKFVRNNFISRNYLLPGLFVSDMVNDFNFNNTINPSAMKPSYWLPNVINVYFGNDVGLGTGAALHPDRNNKFIIQRYHLP